MFDPKSFVHLLTSHESFSMDWLVGNAQQVAFLPLPFLSYTSSSSYFKQPVEVVSVSTESTLVVEVRPVVSTTTESTWISTTLVTSVRSV